MRKTIVVLLVIAGLVAVAFLFGRRTEGSPAATTTPDSGEVVQQDGLIEVFESLDQQRRDAFEALDISLLRQAYTSNSPALQKVITSVRSLIRDAIRPDERVRNQQLSVISISGGTALIRQRMFYDLRFFDSSNTDVTKGGREEQQLIEWVLRKEDNEWRLHAARLLEVQ